MLKLTYKELQQIVEERLEGFYVLYNDIPREGYFRNYIEDDGREYRNFEFEDSFKNTYSFSYVWSPDYDVEFPLAFLGAPPEGIEFVKESVLFPSASKKVEVQEVVSKEKIADIELSLAYAKIETRDWDEVKKLVPKAIVKECVDFLKNEKFTWYELRAKVLPICIKYKIEMNSFWKELQYSAGNWKRPKTKQ